MHDLGAKLQYDQRALEAPKSNVLKVYARLWGYAWRYKLRLTVSLAFALLVAVSIGSMVLSLGTVINVIFLNQPDETVTTGAAARPSEKRDPADTIADKIAEATAKMQQYIRWAPQGLDQRFRDLVVRMRADKMRALAFVCAALILLAAISSTARFIQEYFAGSVGVRVSVDLVDDMYRNVLWLSMGFFERRASGEILARFTNDAFMVNRGLHGVLVKLMREPFKLAVFFVSALLIDPLLTLLALCVLPPVGYAIVRIGQKVRKNVRRSLEKVASITTVAKEAFAGITIVKGFCMESYVLSRIRAELRRLRRYLQRMVKADAAVEPISEFLLVLGLVVFVLVSGSKAAAGKMSAGELLMLYGFLAMMIDPIRKLSAVNNLVQTSVASAERVFEFIDMKERTPESPNAIELPRLRESLRFENVRFSYDGHTEVLRGVDVQIRRGELVALVGFSGSGKSTMVKLIPRFYDVTSGAIRIDGVDIRDATLDSLRRQISVVTQDTILFNESVRDNIAFGCKDYTDEQIQEAARAAHAHDFIQRLRNGYDTNIGEAGVTLSGGQRQRLAIARAIIKNPAILILDEATSHLDTESEQAIQQAMERFVVGRTTIVIAHRLSTVQRADRILVIHEGRLVEQGTHRELLEHGGIYQRLYDLQFKSAESTSATADGRT